MSNAVAVGFKPYAEKPEDRSSFLHDNVTFECDDPDAIFSPLWNISGLVFEEDQLPAEYTVTYRTLTYHNVQQEDTFQCIFNNGTYLRYSRIATLQIYSGEKNCRDNFTFKNHAFSSKW